MLITEMIAADDALFGWAQNGVDEHLHDKVETGGLFNQKRVEAVSDFQCCLRKEYLLHVNSGLIRGQYRPS